MTLPLQLLFHFGPQDLRSGGYRSVLSHYREALTSHTNRSPHLWADLPRPIAYAEVTDAEKPLLPDFIDECYDSDIAPLAQDGTQVLEKGVNHLFHFLDREQIQQVPYTLLVRGSGGLVAPASGQPLFSVLSSAVQLLHQNHHAVSLGFQGLFSFPPPQPLNPGLSVVAAPKWPAVVRTRDLYLALLLSLRQPGAQVEQVLGALSYSPTRHLVFNHAVASLQ